MAENKHFLVTIWKSPSLRGSGLKFLLQFLVSLFEQSPSLRGSGLKSSRFTKHKPMASKSPSLRGSGLKFIRACDRQRLHYSLPLYEGVD